MKFSVLVLVLVLVVTASFGCGVPRQASPPTPLPPRLPGMSITNTKLCECAACTPRSCCVDVGLSAPAGDDYGLSVTSCAPRCGPYAFRVPRDADCDAHRPPACCEG